MPIPNVDSRLFIKSRI